MIFREGCLNLLVGPRNTGKTSLILRGIKSGGWTHGFIFCGTDYSRMRCARALGFPTSEELDDLATTDISDGGIMVLNDIIYDSAQWPPIAERLRDWRRRRITVVVAVIWMYWLEPSLLCELFHESRVFVFRTPFATNRRRLFELFGRHRFPTQADFNTYMDDMGEAPFWYGAFDLSACLCLCDC